VSAEPFAHVGLEESFRQASEQLGYKEVDCNGKDAIGNIISTTVSN